MNDDEVSDLIKEYYPNHVFEYYKSLRQNFKVKASWKVTKNIFGLRGRGKYEIENKLKF